MDKDAKPQPGLVWPRAVVFDWDNTLVDAWGCVTDALNVTREAFRQSPVAIDDVIRYSAKSARNLFKDWYGPEAERAHAIFYESYQSSHLAHVKPMDGAEELLIKLHKKQTPMFVVSNKRGDVLRSECSHLRWDAFFCALVGSTDAPRDKPERDPVDFALKKAFLAADDPTIWFIGDTLSDVQCARNAGCTPVLLHNNVMESNLLAVELSFSRCADLIPFLDSLEQS